MQLIEEKKLIGGVPVLTCKMDDGSKKPLVILSHSFTGNKSQFKEKGYLKVLAEKGYYAVAIDNRLHGDRPGPNFLTSVINTAGKVDLFLLRKAIKETADDVKILIDQLTVESDVDKNRIALFGVSMGGFMTFRSMVIDERIKVGIPVISSPYWDDIPGDTSITDFDENIEKELKIFSEELQPSACIDKFYPRPVLMQVGDIDTHYNVEKVKDFHKRLAEIYKFHPERLKLIVYPDTKHEFKDEMWDQAVQWLKEHL